MDASYHYTWPDVTPPATSSDAVSSYIGSATITLTAVDDVGGSGVASTQWRLNSGAWQDGTTVNVTQPGDYTLEFFSTDVAGNPETTKQVSFTVIPVPTLTGFSPASGPAGASVTITGSGLAGASAVKFNGASASYMVDSATQITAVVPDDATTGPISITTPGGTTTSASRFAAIPVVSGFARLGQGRCLGHDHGLEPHECDSSALQRQGC